MSTKYPAPIWAQAARKVKPDKFDRVYAPTMQVDRFKREIDASSVALLATQARLEKMHKDAGGLEIPSHKAIRDEYNRRQSQITDVNKIIDKVMKMLHTWTDLLENTEAEVIAKREKFVKAIGAAFPQVLALIHRIENQVQWRLGELLVQNKKLETENQTLRNASSSAAGADEMMAKLLKEMGKQKAAAPNDEMKKAHEDLEKLNEELRKQMDELRTTHTQVIQSKDALNAELQRTQDEDKFDIGVKNSMIDGYEGDIKTQTIELRNLQGSNERLQSQVEESDTRAERAEKDLEAEKQTTRELKFELENSKAASEAYKGEYETVKAQMESLNTPRLVNTEEVARNREYLALRHDNATLRGNFNTQKNARLAADEDVKKLQDQSKQHSRDLRRLTREVEDLEAQISSLENELLQATEENETLEEWARGAQEELDLNKEDIDKLQATEKRQLVELRNGAKIMEYQSQERRRMKEAASNFETDREAWADERALLVQDQADAVSLRKEKTAWDTERVRLENEEKAAKSLRSEKITWGQERSRLQKEEAVAQSLRTEKTTWEQERVRLEQVETAAIALQSEKTTWEQERSRLQQVEAAAISLQGEKMNWDTERVRLEQVEAVAQSLYTEKMNWEQDRTRLEREEAAAISLRSEKQTWDTERVRLETEETAAKSLRSEKETWVTERLGLKQSIEKQKTAAEKFDQDKKSWDTERTRFQQSVKEAKDASEQFDGEKKAWDTERTQFQNSVEEAKDASKQFDREKEAWNAERTQFQKSAKEADDASEQFYREKEVWKTERGQLEQSVKEVSEKLNHEKETWDAERSHFQESIDNQTKAAEAFKQEKDNWEVERSRLVKAETDANSNWTNAANKFNQEKQTWETERTQLVQAEVNANSRCTDTTKAFDQERQTWETERALLIQAKADTNSESTNAINSFNEEKQTWETERTRLTNEESAAKTLRQEKINWIAEKKKLDSEISDLKPLAESVPRLKAQVTNLILAKSKLDAVCSMLCMDPNVDLKSLEGIAEEIKLEWENFHFKLVEVGVQFGLDTQADFDEFKSSLEHIARTRNDAFDDIVSLQPRADAASGLEKKVEELQTQITTLTSSADVLREEKTQWLSAKKVLDQQIEEQKKTIKNVNSSLKTRVTVSELSEVQTQLENAEEELEQLQLAHDNRIDPVVHQQLQDAHDARIDSVVYQQLKVAHDAMAHKALQESHDSRIDAGVHRALQEAHDARVPKSDLENLQSRFDDLEVAHGQCGEMVSKASLETLQESYNALVNDHSLCGEKVPRGDFNTLQEKYQTLVEEHNLCGEKVPKADLETLQARFNTLEATHSRCVVSPAQSGSSSNNFVTPSRGQASGYVSPYAGSNISASSYGNARSPDAPFQSSEGQSPAPRQLAPSPGQHQMSGPPQYGQNQFAVPSVPQYGNQPGYGGMSSSQPQNFGYGMQQQSGYVAPRVSQSPQPVGHGMQQPSGHPGSGMQQLGSQAGVSGPSMSHSPSPAPPAGPRYQFLTQGFMANGTFMASDQVDPALTAMMDTQITRWVSQTARGLWTKHGQTSETKCVDVRRSGYGSRAPPGNDPSGNVACEKCITGRRLCVLVPQNGLPVIVPLPPNLRGFGATPSSAAYYHT